MARNNRPGHSKPHGPKELTIKRDEEIWLLRTNEMLTHDAIAKRVGLSQPAVTQSLQRTAARRSETLDKRVQEYRESLMGQLDRIVAETYGAWDKANSGESPSPAQSQYLNTSIKAIERLCKMLGIDAPQQIDSHVKLDPSEIMRQQDERRKRLEPEGD